MLEKVGSHAEIRVRPLGRAESRGRDLLCVSVAPTLPGKAVAKVPDRAAECDAAVTHEFTSALAVAETGDPRPDAVAIPPALLVPDPGFSSTRVGVTQCRIVLPDARIGKKAMEVFAVFLGGAG